MIFRNHSLYLKPAFVLHRMLYPTMDCFFMIFPRVLTNLTVSQHTFHCLWFAGQKHPLWTLPSLGPVLNAEPLVKLLAVV